jgi:amino acid adenylation domain-containing protein/FkbM family methyltransferase
MRASRGKAQFASAVTAVLASYYGSELVAFGICQKSVAIAVSLSTPTSGTLDTLALQAENIIDNTVWDPASFERRVIDAGLSAVVNRNPLFAVLVVLDDRPAPSLRQDLSLCLEHEQTLVADYNTRLFRPEIVSRFLTHVQRMLVALQHTPFSSMSDIRILGEEENAALLAFASGGPPAFDGTIPELLSVALARLAQHPAVEFEGRCWSLEQLVEHADKIAAMLVPHVRSKGARVGVALRPGIHQIAALFAIIRICGVIVPLDTSLPASRQEAIRSDAQLDAIITEDRLAAHFPDSDLINVDHLTASATNAAATLGFVTSRPDDPLYLLFTSGSTGRPKGVLVPHRTLANLIACDDRRRSTTGKRTLGRTSIAFDVGLQEVFATILFGGTLVVATEDERGDVGALASLFARLRVSRVYLPPVALHQMAEFVDANPVGLERLEEVIVAGEQLRISQAIRRFFRATSALLINQYGPTETHVATEFVLDPTPLRWPDLPSIGRPIAGVRAYVVTSAGQLAPVLVGGELLIGGLAPALGYVQSPELTQSRFIRDPFADDPNAVVYRTGDRARWLSDGRLEFLGRQDDQVKIRGYRVELSDLEANAERLPGVRLVAAKYWATEAWKGLALYLVLRDYSRASVRELRSALREYVPEYMVPPLSAMVLLDHLPLTASGKVDRAKLPYPGAAEEAASSTMTTADRVAGIWSRRIGIGRVGPDDDFLDLGGHSLLAIQIVSEVNDAFNIGVPLSTLLRGTSLREFTDVVERLLAAKSERASFKPSPSDRATKYEAVDQSAISVVVLPGGKFAAISSAEARQLWTEIFDQHAYRHPSFRYRPGGTVIDVGANIGIFSHYVLQETGGCRLIAIEPAVELYRCLEQNLREVASRVDLLQLGCGAEDLERSTFFYFPQVPSMSSFAPNPDQDKSLLAGLLGLESASPDVARAGVAQERYLDAAFESSREIVQVRRLSTVMRELNVGTVDLLKIDVQRGEQNVLRGVDSDDWKRVSQVVVELQDYAGSADATLSSLKSVGFEVDIGSIALHRGTPVRFVYGWRR